jgi:hypothetical protein
MEPVAGPGASVGGSRMFVVPGVGALPRPTAAARAIPRRREGRRRWFKPEGGGPEHEADTGEARPPGMAPAVALCGVSTVLAGVVAYGTHPAWAQYPRGLQFILLSRQLQWPFIALSLIAAVALMATVIAGRRRAFWLIGLAPILALFGHRFATDPAKGMAALENPTFVTADGSAHFLKNDDYVLGLTFEGKNYAYPFAALYSTPVVIHAQHDKRLLVMWSAPANRAVAYTVSRDVRARDLDVVSTPANALLVYDTSRGVFINGLTGRTMTGDKPAGFGLPVATAKMAWWKWRMTHAETQVMVPVGRLSAGAPRQPLTPTQPMPPVDAKYSPETKIVVIGSDKPAAVLATSLGSSPVNLTADNVPVFAFREPENGVARGFRRRIDDLAPRFKASRDTNRKGVLFMDSDTSSGWNATGVAVDAKKEFRGKKLAAIPVEDEVYWGVMKYWYPELQLANGDPNAPQAVIEINGSPKPSNPETPRPEGPAEPVKATPQIVTTSKKSGNGQARPPARTPRTTKPSTAAQ